MKIVKKYLKFVVSAGMILIVSLKVDFRGVFTKISHVPIEVFIFGIVGYFLTLLISTYRWWKLAKAAGVKCSFGRTLSAALIGAYANTFGLGTVGGDLIKGALLSSGDSSRTAALASVAADRVLGLGVLAGIGVISAGLVTLPGQAHSYVLVAVAVVILGTLAWFFIPTILGMLSMTGRVSKILKEASKAFPRDRAILVEVLSLGVLFHIAQFLVVAVMVSMMGIKIPLPYFFAALPIANIGGTLPLSWMGLGVREGLYILLFSPTYMTSENAIVFSMLWFVSIMGASVIGGVVAVLTGDLSQTRNEGSKPVDP